MWRCLFGDFCASTFRCSRRTSINRLRRWLPLTLALIMFTIMTTWKSERFRLLRRMHEHGNSLEAMIASLEKSPPVRVPGPHRGVYAPCAERDSVCHAA
ncbi:hypothetical protein ACLK1Y_20915 [Escherichia coli]